MAVVNASCLLQHVIYFAAATSSCWSTLSSGYCVETWLLSMIEVKAAVQLSFLNERLHRALAYAAQAKLRLSAASRLRTAYECVTTHHCKARAQCS